MSGGDLLKGGGHWARYRASDSAEVSKVVPTSR
jgi:hypothetical protein